MIIQGFEAARRTYSRLTFAVKAAIMVGIAAVVFLEYRSVMAERADLVTSDARSPKDAIISRLYGMALSVSNLTE